MTTTIEYALLAGASYYDTRAEIYRFPLPQNWSVISRIPWDKSTGFEASSFKNGTDIVISYAGTYDQDIKGDMAADAGLALGNGSIQLLQAAEYYLSIKNDPRYQGCNITLTGHSLGGGLASLIGVFFALEAHTFDQAPFAKSAQLGFPPDVAAYLKSDLLVGGHTEAELSALRKY